MKRTVVLSALLALMLSGCATYDEAGYSGLAVYPTFSFGWYDDFPSYGHYPGFYGGYRGYYGGHHGHHWSGHGGYHGGHHGGSHYGGHH